MATSTLRNAPLGKVAMAACVATMVVLAGSGVTAAPQPGQRFRDWVVACEPVDAGGADGGQESCFLVQHVLLKETGQRLVSIGVGYLGSQGEPGAILTLPLGIFLPPGISIRIDDDDPVRLAVERCDPSGCKSGLALDPALIAKLKAGRVAHIGFYDGNRRRIEVPVSLMGFTAGYQSLEP